MKKTIISLLSALVTMALPMSANAATLNGTDVSSHQTLASSNCAAIPGDFIIIKATQGTGYTFPSFDRCVRQSLASGKRVMAYDFAEPSSTGPIAEANHFLDHVKKFKGTISVALDYETNTDVAWAKAWLDYVSANMSTSPYMYLSASTVNSVDWSAVSGTYPLWIAGYRYGNARFSDFAPYPLPYGIGSWGNVSMFQYTSSGYLHGIGPYDFNVFYGDVATWDRIANTTAPKTSTATVSGTVDNIPTSQTVTTYTDEQMADRVIRGLYGNNPYRQRALGSRYNAVMAIVNQRLGVTATPTSASGSYYIVRKGDCLSKLWPTTWRTIARMNNMSAPWTIYPGQRLRTTSRASAIRRSYVVRKGDTLSIIATRLGVSQSTVRGYRSGNPNLIYVGEVLYY